ncbi:cytochrome P450 [Mycolicibacterium vinylchloridicum]|uniref:cytochrome P450 n=1 Tax=Mycolicibacterium vinylchloridicum TaxID=2736928 RepID=UPI0015CBB63C|nr:cytochrome P450 [Mycolicibacterium vinylchloridicum]
MTIEDTEARTPRPYHSLDLSDRAFWEQTFPTRDETFAELRAEAGLSWHRPVSTIFPSEETGYWAITRHADLKYVSQHNELFGSRYGISIDYMPAEVQQISTFFLAMDPPEHSRYRRLISSVFTPRQVKLIEDQIRVNAAEIVDDLLEKLSSGAEIDFVAECSAKLPMRTVSDMIGIDPGDREAVAYAAEALFGGTDAEYADIEEIATHTFAQLTFLNTTGTELAQRRRIEPADDLMTRLVEADIDGERLTDTDIGSFMVLLAAAGNDTTKQTTSHGFKALADHPEQVAWLLEDFDNRIDGAIEELVRWSNPLIAFARTALADTELAGESIKAGEKVVLFYCSANRDTSAFDRANEFDITRTPNPHVGFGGGGAHFCLGAQVAKMQLRHLFQQLLTRLPRVELGQPEYLHSSLIHGVKHMSVKLAD